MTKDEKAYAIIAGNQVLHFNEAHHTIASDHSMATLRGVSMLIEAVAKIGGCIEAYAVNPQTLEVEHNHMIMLFPGPGTLISVRPWEEFLEYARAAQKEAERRAAEQKRAEETRKKQENALMQQIMSGSPSVQPPILIPRPIPGKRR